MAKVCCEEKRGLSTNLANFQTHPIEANQRIPFCGQAQCINRPELTKTSPMRVNRLLLSFPPKNVPRAPIEAAQSAKDASCMPDASSIMFLASSPAATSSEMGRLSFVE